MLESMRYLGIDYGLKRIGLAFSEGSLASAWKVIEINSLSDAVKKIISIIQQERIDHVVIGLPEGDMEKAVNRFISEMNKQGIIIHTSDETLSTRQAMDLMIKLGKSKKDRKMNDAVAASEILQNYLDNKD